MMEEIQSAGQQSEQYRKGLVLGFTVAETMILILFALLLALGAKLRDLDEVAQTHYDLVQVMGDNIGNIEKLVEQARQAEKLSEDVKVFEDKLNQLNALEKFVEEEDLDNDFTELLQRAELGGRLQEAVAADNALLKDPTFFDDLPKAVEFLKENAGSTDLLQAAITKERELDNLKGQFENLREKLNQAGLGTEFPPCWSTPNGKPEYIFDIALEGEGLRVRNAAPDYRNNDFLTLGVRGSVFEGSLTPANFSKQTAPIFEWGKKQIPECRFFVRIFDFTSSNSKSLYKSRLRTVEAHFYKYEMVNVSNWLE